jgi:hypothetical protein
MNACHERVGTNGMISVRGIGLMIRIEFDNKKEEIRKSLIIQERAPTIMPQEMFKILIRGHLRPHIMGDWLLPQ